MDQGLLDGIVSILGYVAGILGSVVAIVSLINRFLKKWVQFSRIIQVLWSSWSRRTAVLGIIVTIITIILSAVLQQSVALLVSLALLIICTIFVLYILLGPERKTLLQKPPHPKRKERFSENKVIVGAKEFLEQAFLCEIVARVIERDNPDLKVLRSFEGPGTRPVYDALNEGKIDLYVEYTGTALTYLGDKSLEEAKNKSAWEVGLFRGQDLVMMQSLGYDSGYVLVMLRKRANELNITSISDLSKVSGELTFKGTKEFDKRPDGFKALQKEYGLYFAVKDVVLEQNRYDALLAGEMDVTSGFAADPEIILEKDTFMKLDDDRELFPSGHAFPLVHQDLINRFPKILESLKKLEGAIGPEDIARLNHEGIKKNFHQRLNRDGIRNLVNRFLKRMDL